MHFVFRKTLCALSCSMDIIIWSNGWGHAVYGVWYAYPGPLTRCLLPYGVKTATGTLIKLYKNKISGGNGLLWKEQNDYRHFYYSSCIWWNGEKRKRPGENRSIYVNWWLVVQCSRRAWNFLWALCAEVKCFQYQRVSVENVFTIHIEKTENSWG